jgi:tetratricopeptide (TPR) repeat protein
VTLASNVVFAGPRISGSATVLEKALELATQGTVDSGRLMARVAGIHWQEFGDAQRQAEYERLALEISRATGDATIEMLTFAGRGSAAYFRYEYGEALAALLRVIELARSRSDTQAEVTAYLFAGRSHLALGKGHKAEEQAQALGDLVNRTGSASRPYYLVAALYAAVRGDWTKTRQAAKSDGAGPFTSILAFVTDAQTELKIDASPLEELSVGGQQYLEYPDLGLLRACFADSVRLDSSEREGLIRLIDDTRYSMDQGSMRHDRYLELSTRLAASTACLAESTMPKGLVS